MNRGRGQPKEPLDIGLRWRPPVHQRVGVYERVILSLPWREAWVRSVARFAAGLESGGPAACCYGAGGTERGGREQLTSMLSGGKHAVRKLRRAQILLAAEAGVSDEAIASSVSVGASTGAGPSDASWKAIWSLALSEETRPGVPASCLVRKRRYWWRPPVPVRRRDASAGHSIFWLARWSGSRRMKGCHARRCAGVWPRTI